MSILTFLHCGTAFAAYLDGEIFPHDKDVDLAVPFEQIGDRMEEVVEAITILGYKVKQVKAPFAFTRALKVDGDNCHMDIACYFKEGKQRFCPASRQNYALVMPNEMFLPITTVEMYGRRFWMHNPPEEYIKMNYGDDWKTPKQNASSKSLNRVYWFRPGEAYLIRDHSDKHLDDVHQKDGYYAYLSGKPFLDTIMPPIAEGCVGSVLDVGCGQGHLLKYIAGGKKFDQPFLLEGVSVETLLHDRDYHGVDGSKTAITQAKNINPECPEGSPGNLGKSSFSVGRLENYYLYSSDKFDTAVFSGILFSMIKANLYVEFLQKYIKHFRFKRLVISDLQKMDRSSLEREFNLISRKDVEIPSKAIKFNVRNRFVEVYNV